MSAYSFDTTPSVKFARSRLNLGHRVKTSIRVGDLVPVDVREVLPGDTWSCDEHHLVRLTSSYLRPVMDNCWMDVYSFFVPLRLLYNKLEGVFANDSPNAYVKNALGRLPYYDTTVTISPKTVGDYLGLPVGTLPSGLTVTKFRGFALIYDQWFRNQNVIDPMLVQLGECASSERPNNNKWGPSNYTGKLPKVSKKKDYFTSGLPSPQKGEGVTVSVLNGHAPIRSGDGNAPTKLHINSATPSTVPGFLVSPFLFSDPNTEVRNKRLVANSDGRLGDEYVTPAGGDQVFMHLYGDLQLAYADISSVSAANVNDLRFAFQMQKMLERDARGGGRFREYLLAHWGVQNADSRMQIPEFLGGKRTPLNLQQVAQTSAGTSDSPLASLGGYSQTMGKSSYRKSFTEPGYIYTVACIRYEHSYQQGIDRSWFRKRREDFYDPLFASLGEQPVYRAQIYGFADANDTLTSHGFAYQEAWADYRYAPDIITGEMRSSAANSFDIYHFGDNYADPPVLSKDFVEENAAFFRRTTSVSDEADVDDFIVDFYFDCYAYRVMPVRSVPGLIDHH